MFRLVLNVSAEGDSMAALCSLLQYSVTLTVRSFLLIFRWNLMCFSLCPLSLAMSLGSSEKSLCPSFWPQSLQCFYALIRSPLCLLFFRLSREIRQTFLIMEMLQSSWNIEPQSFLSWKGGVVHQDSQVSLCRAAFHQVIPYWYTGLFFPSCISPENRIALCGLKSALVNSVL